MIKCRAKALVTFEVEVSFDSESESIRDILSQAAAVAAGKDVTQHEPMYVKILGVTSDEEPT